MCSACSSSPPPALCTPTPPPPPYLFYSLQTTLQSMMRIVGTVLSVSLGFTQIVRDKLACAVCDEWPFAVQWVRKLSRKHCAHIHTHRGSEAPTETVALSVFWTQQQGQANLKMSNSDTKLSSLGKPGEHLYFQSTSAALKEAPVRVNTCLVIVKRCPEESRLWRIQHSLRSWSQKYGLQLYIWL